MQHKQYGLDPPYRGPFKILQRLSRSTVRIQVGTYADGSARTEDRHWCDLKPIKLQDSEIKLDERPKLGRKPIDKPTITTGPPTEKPFTGFHSQEIPQKKNLFAEGDWSDMDIAKIDFTKPPPNIKPWSASKEELAKINQSINSDLR